MEQAIGVRFFRDLKGIRAQQKRSSAVIGSGSTGSLIQWTYNRLPSGLRNVAASLRGWWLKRERYGPETEGLIAAALARESWDSGRWEDWQREKLASLLRHASTRVPYYRDRLAGLPGSVAGRLEDWPILDKAEVRKDPTAFVADGLNRNRLVHDHTSGTTGQSLDLWFTPEAVRQWYALFEARWRRWYGVSIRENWGILGGQMVVPVARRRPPFWVWNGTLNQLYCSVYHLAPDLIPFYVEEIRRRRLVYLLGYTSALCTLAQGILDGGGADLRLKVVITNAEPVYEHQRELMRRAFGCPVRETYGLSEAVAAASECEEGRLHLWPEAGVVEVLGAGGRAAPPGEPGDLVTTGLLNTAMPLVRYRVGDRITMAPPDSICSCGRLLPLVERIEGRCDDVLLTRDGREVGRLDPVFKATTAVQEAQIIQESLETIRILYVAGPGFCADDEELLRSRLRERMGDVEVVLEAVAGIPRGANGKFRAVIRRFTPPAPEKARPA